MDLSILYKREFHLVTCNVTVAEVEDNTCAVIDVEVQPLLPCSVEQLGAGRGRHPGMYRRLEAEEMPSVPRGRIVIATRAAFCSCAAATASFIEVLRGAGLGTQRVLIVNAADAAAAVP